MNAHANFFLNIWFNASEEALLNAKKTKDNKKSKIWRKNALKWKVKGLIEQARSIDGRSPFTGQWYKL